MSSVIPFVLTALLSFATDHPAWGESVASGVIVRAHAPARGGTGPLTLMKAWSYEHDDAAEGLEDDGEDTKTSGRQDPVALTWASFAADALRTTRAAPVAASANVVSERLNC